MIEPSEDSDIDKVIFLNNQDEDVQILPLYKKLVYALPNFSQSFAMGLYNVWLFKYYSDTERLSLNETNLGYIISMWVFLLSLPITAYLADNWKTPWGRRRQWMIFVAPIFFGITFLLFYVPPVPRFLV